MQVITLLPLSVIGNMHFLGLSNKNIHLAVVFVLFCRKPSIYCSVVGCCGTFGLFFVEPFYFTDCMEEHSLCDVGHRRAGVVAISLEYILYKYRSKLSLL